MPRLALVGLVTGVVAVGALAFGAAPTSSPIDPSAPKFQTAPMDLKMFAQAGGTLEYVESSRCFALRNDFETYEKNGKRYARPAVHHRFLIWPTGTRAQARGGEIEVILPEGEVVRTGQLVSVGGGSAETAGLDPRYRCTGSDHVFFAWTAEGSEPSAVRNLIEEYARTGAPLPY